MGEIADRFVAIVLERPQEKRRLPVAAARFLRRFPAESRDDYGPRSRIALSQVQHAGGDRSVLARQRLSRCAIPPIELGAGPAERLVEMAEVARVRLTRADAVLDTRHGDPVR